MNATLKIESKDDWTPEQGGNIIEGNDPVLNAMKKVWKITADIKNANEKSKCFPKLVHAEWYNLDYFDEKQKIFNYAMTYMGLTIVLIYVMVFEFVKLTQDNPRENA